MDHQIAISIFAATAVQTVQLGLVILIFAVLADEAASAALRAMKKPKAVNKDTLRFVLTHQAILMSLLLVVVWSTIWYKPPITANDWPYSILGLTSLLFILKTAKIDTRLKTYRKEQKAARKAVQRALKSESGTE